MRFLWDIDIDGFLVGPSCKDSNDAVVADRDQSAAIPRICRIGSAGGIWSWSILVVLIFDKRLTGWPSSDSSRHCKETVILIHGIMEGLCRCFSLSI